MNAVLDIKRNLRWILTGVILVLVLAGVGIGILRHQSKQNLAEVSASETMGQQTDPDYRQVTWDGKHYSYNNQVTAILYAGVDSDSELVTSNRYTIAPRADTIELIILDGYHKKTSILAISRDMITSVGRYTMNGHFRGYYDTQLGYAYAYGDGGKVSCRNLLDAVSNLLGGVPIHEYAITGYGIVVELNDLVGGVTVTVPNDDLSGEYPELSQGKTVKLNRSNVDAFVRWRDTSLPFSNNGRMERQQVFSAAFLETFRTQAADRPEAVWEQIEGLNGSIQTSITEGQYLKLLNGLSENAFSEENYYYLEGTHGTGPLHDEVHPDPERNTETILELFYLCDEE